MTPKQIAGLFEFPRMTMRYRDHRAELRAIAAGTKMMSFFDGTIDELDGPSPFVAELMSLAATLDLRVVLHRRPTRMFTVFVVRADQTWRVPAFELLHRGGHGWPDFAEVATSRLLGYSEPDIRRWLAMCHRRGAWRTYVYLLLTPAQRRALRDVADRCLPAGSLGAGATAFCIYRTCVLRDDARARLRGLAIARAELAGVTQRFPRPPDGWIATRQLGERDRVGFNRALRGDKIEVWARGRWR